MSDPANPFDKPPAGGSPQGAPASSMSAADAVAAVEARSEASGKTPVPPIPPANPFTAPAAPPDDPPPPPPGRFVGPERAFWRLLTRGAALLLITLGIYRFWLTTDIRRFLWSNTEVAGDYLEYIGTARELLLGFLIAIALLVPINIVLFLTTLSSGLLGQIAGALTLVLLGLLGQFAVYRARRYRLTRTLYRGIRFHQTGAAWRYAICAIFWWATIGLTLGLAYPWAQASLERFKLRNTHYGDLQGQFVGSG